MPKKNVFDFQEKFKADRSTFMYVEFYFNASKRSPFKL